MKEVLQVLTIAGMNSDSSQGITADLHTFHNHKLYAMSVQTVAVAGCFDTLHGIQKLPVSFIEQQFQAIQSVAQLKAIKTGILMNEAMLSSLRTFLDSFQEIPIVIDPVFATKFGKCFITNESLAFVKSQLIPKATVVTPNFHEAQILYGKKITSKEDEVKAIKKIQSLGAKNVVLKRANLYEESPIYRDIFLLENGEMQTITHEFISTKHTNGAGDVLSATITALLAKNEPVDVAIKQAVQETRKAIRNEINVGESFGPVNLLL